MHNTVDLSDYGTACHMAFVSDGYLDVLMKRADDSYAHLLFNYVVETDPRTTYGYYCSTLKLVHIVPHEVAGVSWLLGSVSANQFFTRTTDSEGNTYTQACKLLADS